MTRKDLLELYMMHPLLKMHIDEVKAKRPSVQPWTKTATHEDWVFETGRQAGFDMAMAYFYGE